MEFIGGILIAIYCFYDLWRDRRDAKSRTEFVTLRISADISVERDGAGNIHTIRISL